MTPPLSTLRYGQTPDVLATLQSKVRHVFVLMLENRSFDHLFGYSGIPGIRCATPADVNLVGAASYPSGPAAPDPISSDPGHEFNDVLLQLTGSSSPYAAGRPYPPITNGGFAASYATSTSEGAVPAPARIGDIMLGVDTPNELPALLTLATQFALCDHWFSALPGPTWPNRFFVHGASSSGLDDSPTEAELALWNIGEGFRYANGSIFDQLGSQRYRIYHDETGPDLGCIPQVTSIQGVHFLEAGNLDHFAEDLADPQGYPYAYTFIEPAYGDIAGRSYQGGSSQHPMDRLGGGDALVRRVYQALKQSPLWASSLLIITYDEHGGFYDSVPPGPVTPPGDSPPDALGRHGFDFSVRGVRVPAVIVSPWIAKGVVDSTVYDHTSVLATLECLFDLPALTARDAAANDLLHLLGDELRADCPELAA